MTGASMMTPASNCSCIDAPLALETGAAERQDDVALGRFRLEDVDEDRVPDGQLRLALAVATEQLAVADDALALGTDVDEDLVLVDADDLALDDVAVLEALDVGVLLGEQLLHRRRLGAERARRRGLLLVVARGGRVGGLVVGSACRRRPGPAVAAGRVRLAGAVGATGASGSLSLSAPRVRPARGRRVDACGVGRCLRLGRAVARPRPASVAARSSVLVAGSSATATAATVSSDAWSAAEAMASGSGVVPPCCSSVKVSGHSWWWICARESRTA